MFIDTCQVAAHLTRFAAQHCARGDVVVRVDLQLPGPAQFDHATAQITVNPQLILNPIEWGMLADDPSKATSFGRLAGALVHEVGHADHTRRRQLPAELEPWAALLEEPRIEAAMLAGDPDLRLLLAESAAAAVMGEPRAGHAVDAIEEIGRAHV